MKSFKSFLQMFLFRQNFLKHFWFQKSICLRFLYIFWGGAIATFSSNRNFLRVYFQFSNDSIWWKMFHVAQSFKKREIYSDFGLQKNVDERITYVMVHRKKSTKLSVVSVTPYKSRIGSSIFAANFIFNAKRTDKKREISAIQRRV